MEGTGVINYVAEKKFPLGNEIYLFHEYYNQFTPLAFH